MATYVRSANVRSHPKILQYIDISYVLSTVQIIRKIKRRMKGRRRKEEEEAD